MVSCVDNNAVRSVYKLGEELHFTNMWTFISWQDHFICQLCINVFYMWQVAMEHPGNSREKCEIAPLATRTRFRYPIGLYVTIRTAKKQTVPNLWSARNTLL